MNNDYFTIERSKYGRDWQEIDRINGKGNSNKETFYSSIDTEPFMGRSYYRLKQVDFDTHYAYSDIVHVFIPDALDNHIKIHPNPTQQSVLVEHASAELLIINVFNAQGKRVTEIIEITRLDEGRIMLDLFQANEGLYLIKTNLGTSKVYKR